MMFRGIQYEKSGESSLYFIHTARPVF